MNDLTKERFYEALGVARGYLGVAASLLKVDVEDLLKWLEANDVPLTYGDTRP